jgi:hypothetical protein
MINALPYINHKTTFIEKGGSTSPFLPTLPSTYSKGAPASRQIRTGAF